MIDLNTLTENRIAVRCETEEIAQEFLSAMFAYLPQACRHWHEGDTSWGVYREDTCYSIGKDFDGDGPMMYYSPGCEYESDGYRIVNFNEVIFTTPDLGALDVSSANLSYLFGTEVSADA